MVNGADFYGKLIACLSVLIILAFGNKINLWRKIHKKFVKSVASAIPSLAFSAFMPPMVK